MGDAIFRQKNGILAIAIVANCGILSSEQLLGLGKLAREVDSPGCKFSSRQTIIMLIAENKLNDLKKGIAELGLAIGVFGEVIRNIKVCSGSPDLCNRSLADVISLAGELQPKFMNEKVPCDFKIAIAGCCRGCTDPLCADFGVMAVSKDCFDIYIGGRGSTTEPVHAVKIAEKIGLKGVEEILQFTLEKYRQHAEDRERLCSTITRVGLTKFTPSNEVQSKYAVTPENDFLIFAGFK